MITVALVDDHAIIREGLKSILGGDPRISVVGEAGSLRELRQLLESISPKIVLLDICMDNEESGFSALRMINEDATGTMAIILSVYSEPHIVRKALALGAKGYVAKHEATNHILQAIRTVAAGGTYVTPETIRSLFEAQDIEPDTRLPLPSDLTRREREILDLIAHWHSTKEIAGMLGISNSTVGTHIENIKRKLKLSSKQELIQHALSH